MAQLPSNTDRILIVGKTGSGKTQAGVWHLSKRDFGRFPWVIFDWKRDKLIAQTRAIELPLDKLPEPGAVGLYVYRPNPDDDVEPLLWQLWARENIGLYFDEGYMIGDSKAFRALLTQGRSKHIPMIINSQRPVWLTRFAISESDYIQLFKLTDDRDIKTMLGVIPREAAEKLPRFHSWYYDVGDDELIALAPVPSSAEILARFLPEPEPEPEPLDTRRVVML